MRILLSAYDCDPYLGSESGVGWNWALNLGRKHDVTVLTREVHRKSIESYARPLPGGLQFEYYDNPARLSRLARVPYRGHLYYGAWQRDILLIANKLHKKHAFDVAQHITWGAWRQPSHLHRAGIPLVFGPVGGGETTPRRLLQSLDLRRRSEERTRYLVNHMHRYSPALRECLEKSILIACRTEETRAWIPKRLWSKTLIHREIGVDGAQIASKSTRAPRNEKLRILYVGRFLGWKGIHLGLKAFAAFLRKYPGAGEFTLVGARGSSRNKILKLVSPDDLSNSVRFYDWLPRADVQELYRNHDVFLFPSFHDSGGTVVLESLTAGLPVICLGLGGPPNMLGDKAGLVIPAKTQSADEIIAEIAKALETLHKSPFLLDQLRSQALARAHELTWEKTIDSVYEHIRHILCSEHASKTIP